MDIRSLLFPRNTIALVNLITFLQKYGLKLGKRTELQYAQGVLEKNSALVADLLAALEKYEVFKSRFISHLENIINNLDEYIPGYEWRPTQRENLLALIEVLEKNYTRPVSEMPTGSGKSLVIGALVRAFLDTCADLGIEQYVYIGTSRSNVVLQMMGIEEIVSQNEDEEDTINIGDVRLMLGNLDERDFRIIPETKKEKKVRGAHTPKVTISTNHALTPESYQKLFPFRLGLAVLDECHHTTPRMQMILRSAQSFFFGYSGTTVGPQFRSPFELFDPIAETQQDYEQAETFEDLLAYHKSLAEMIANGELKPVRYLESKIKIRLDDSVQPTSAAGTKYTILNDAVVAQFMGKYASKQVEFLQKLFLSEHPELTLTGSLHPAKRKGLVGVARIVDAQYCADQFNLLIKPELAKQGIYAHASYVSGKMSKKEFKDEMDRWLVTGETTLMFTAEKLGEGADTVPVNMICNLRPLGAGSLWKLKQFIGRGTRINPDSPEDDLLVCDGVFTSDRFELASIFGILGQSYVYNGGLLASREERVLLERKIFKYLSWGLKPSEVLLKLEPEEKANALAWNILRQYEHEVGSSPDVFETNSSIISIKFIERKEVALFATLGNRRLLAELAIAGLQKEKLTTVKAINSFIKDSCEPFLAMKFETVVVSEIIRLLTGKNVMKKNATKDSKKEAVTEFISVLQSFGFDSSVTTDELHTKQTSFGQFEDLESALVDMTKVNEVSQGDEHYGAFTNRCLQLFGLKPTTRLVERNGIFLAQLVIKAYGYERFSTISFALTKKEALKKAGKEILDALENDIRNGTLSLYQDSREFVQKLLLLEKLVLESKLKVEIQSGFNERLEVYSATAFIKLGRKEFKGEQVFHSSPTKATLWARIALCDHLMKLSPVPDETFVPSDPNAVKKEEQALRLLCEEKRLNLILETVSRSVTGVASTMIWTCKIKIVDTYHGSQLVIADMFYELFEQNARNAALKKAFDAVLNHAGTEQPQTKAQVTGLLPYQELVQIKQKKQFRISNLSYNYEGGYWKIALRVTIKKEGVTTIFDSQVYEGIEKNTALAQCAQELLPQVKNHFGME